MSSLISLLAEKGLSVEHLFSGKRPVRNAFVVYDDDDGTYGTYAYLYYKGVLFAEYDPAWDDIEGTPDGLHIFVSPSKSAVMLRRAINIFARRFHSPQRV